MSTKTSFLQIFLNDIGNSVHSMNTIAVSLSNINPTIETPEGLNISWNVGNLQATKEMSRNFVVRSAIVYAVEALYEYLRSISNSPLWIQDNKFSDVDGDSKAIKTYNFLNSLKSIQEEYIILVELLCHWRNKVVHSYTSNAQLSSRKIQRIQAFEEKLFQELRHFSINIALENFQKQQVTLKDASTLITLTIKCARAVEEYYINQLPNNKYIDFLKSDITFNKIYTQQNSEKRTRQIKKWISLNHSYISQDIIDNIGNLQRK